jgi:hypothetical protein
MHGAATAIPDSLFSTSMVFQSCPSLLTFMVKYIPLDSIERVGSAQVVVVVVMQQPTDLPLCRRCYSPAPRVLPYFNEWMGPQRPNKSYFSYMWLDDDVGT